MNLNNNPTIDQLRDLIATGDDSKGNHVLWVTKDGEVRLTKLPPLTAYTPELPRFPDMQLLYEPFWVGNEYVGPEAATDDEWMSQLFQSLLKEWPAAREKSEVPCISVDDIPVES